MSEGILLLLVIGVMVAGIVVGWTWRNRSGASRSVSTADVRRSGWPLQSSGDHRLGFIRARSGMPPLVSRSLARTLAGVAPDMPLQNSKGDALSWAGAVDPDDRLALESMLESHSDEQDTIQIRVRIPPGASEDPSGSDEGVRWFEVRKTNAGEDPVELVLVDDTPRIDANRQRMLQLRNQRILDLVTDRISMCDDFAQAMDEVLPAIGEGLNLLGAGWYRDESSSEGIAWEVQTSWKTGGDRPMPERLEGADILPEDVGTGSRPRIGLPGRPDMLLMPISGNERVTALLLLETHRGDPWADATTDMISRIADLLGRCLEREHNETEREAWAATRGSFERSEAIAQLTGGVAHDFNGVLFAVLGRFEILRSRIDDPEVLRELDAISETLQEARRLGDRLRQALRPGGDPLALDARIELEEICGSIRRLMPKRITFGYKIDLPTLVRPVEIYTRINDLQRILFNLLVNARDALGTHGRIQLGARLLDEHTLEIRVDDDGPGIPPEDRSRMLEPYETGDESEGVGLGLAVSLRTAEELGGTMVLEESPLGGLAARVVLPVRNQTSEEAPQTEDGSLDGDPSIDQVLIVEDNPVIRDVLVKVVADMGAKVRSQGHAVGIEEVIAKGPALDLMIFDIDLPERTGVACLRDLRQTGDLTPCLLITGGTSQEPSIPMTGFLRKPFRIEELRQMIRRLVAGG